MKRTKEYKKSGGIVKILESVIETPYEKGAPEDLTWLQRIVILLFFLIAAYYVTFDSPIPDELIKLLNGSENDILISSVTILTFGIIFSIGGWVVRTCDKKKEFKDSFRQQNETILSNALRLLFDEGNKSANSVGLREIMQLKKDGVIGKKRIDQITSSGLDIKGVSLSNADLSEADLRDVNLNHAKLNYASLIGVSLHYAKLYEASLKYADLSNANLIGANLSNADLTGANLSNANLCGANLEFVRYDREEPTFFGAVYNEETLKNSEHNPHLINTLKKQGKKEG